VVGSSETLSKIIENLLSSAELLADVSVRAFRREEVLMLVS